MSKNYKQPNYNADTDGLVTGTAFSNFSTSVSSSKYMRNLGQPLNTDPETEFYESCDGERHSNFRVLGIGKPSQRQINRWAAKGKTDKINKLIAKGKIDPNQISSLEEMEEEEYGDESEQVDNIVKDIKKSKRQEPTKQTFFSDKNNKIIVFSLLGAALITTGFLIYKRRTA